MNQPTQSETPHNDLVLELRWRKPNAQERARALTASSFVDVAKQFILTAEYAEDVDLSWYFFLQIEKLGMTEKFISWLQNEWAVMSDHGHRFVAYASCLMPIEFAEYFFRHPSTSDPIRLTIACKLTQKVANEWRREWFVHAERLLQELITSPDGDVRQKVSDMLQSIKKSREFAGWID